MLARLLGGVGGGGSLFHRFISTAVNVNAKREPPEVTTKKGQMEKIGIPTQSDFLKLDYWIRQKDRVLNQIKSYMREDAEKLANIIAAKLTIGGPQDFISILEIVKYEVQRDRKQIEKLLLDTQTLKDFMKQLKLELASTTDLSRKRLGSPTPLQLVSEFRKQSFRSQPIQPPLLKQIQLDHRIDKQTEKSSDKVSKIFALLKLDENQVLLKLDPKTRENVVEVAKIIAKKLFLNETRTIIPIINIVTVEAQRDEKKVEKLRSDKELLERFIKKLKEEESLATYHSGKGLQFSSPFTGVHHFRKHSGGLEATPRKYFYHLPKQLFQPAFLIKTGPGGLQHYQNGQVFGILRVDPDSKKETILTIRHV